MLERLKHRMPLLFMNFLLTVWISYAYLHFAKADLPLFRVICFGLIAVVLSEMITANGWTFLATGVLGTVHILASLFPIPVLHTWALGINACLEDTYLKVFWTDRHMFVSELGTIFVVFFAVAFSIHLFYVKMKSVGLTAVVSMLYIFFMEFFNVADSWFVLVCALHMVFALLLLYVNQWHQKASGSKKTLGLQYGIPLLCFVLILTVLFSVMVTPKPNLGFRDWFDETMEEMWMPLDAINVAPRFSHDVFHKNGKIGGDTSFKGEYRFSVVAYTQYLGYPGDLTQESLYLRGIACDYFEDGAWQTAIDTGRDRLLADFYEKNTYFSADGNDAFVENILAQGTDLFQSCTYRVFYDDYTTGSLLTHTYMTRLTPNGSTEQSVYYDNSTYTYQKGAISQFDAAYLYLDRNSSTMQNLLDTGEITSFAEYTELDSAEKKQITAYYLKMPEDVTERVTTLAQRITASDSNDYEKAASIEDYLKRNYTYTLKPGEPPKDQNIVEYFLFDSKKGYCTYYASAMVLMCRSIGIPARYVQGYRADNVENGRLVNVLDTSAHAWVEAFIPQLGWVTFDPVSAASFAQNEADYQGSHNPGPTPTRKPEPKPPITQGRPGVTATLNQSDEVIIIKPTPTPTSTIPVSEAPFTPTPTQTPTQSPTQTPIASVPPVKGEVNVWIWWILGGAALFVLLALILLFVLVKRAKQAAVVKQDALHLYKKLCRIKAFMGVPQQAGETVTQYLNRLGKPELQILIDIFEACFYNLATLTKEQYEQIQKILQQEENMAIKEKGKLKWLLFRLRYKP